MREAVVSRPLAFAARHARSQAERAIKKDVVRALVELILNADDSYRRLELAGRDVVGRIVIEIERHKNSPTILSIQDWAEGMTPERLDEAVGTYGEDLAGGEVRGFFGHGLKDAMAGLGTGSVTSVHGGMVSTSELTATTDGGVKYSRFREEHTGERRGTAVSIQVDRDGVVVPFADSLRRELSRYYSLRDLAFFL